MIELVKSPVMSHLITLDTPEFLKALRRLKPKRVNKAVQADALYIAYLDSQAVFCTSGVETRCPVLGAKWPGYASVTFGFLLPFLRVKPIRPQVSISFADGRLKIETLSWPSKWATTQPWIAAASIEAHFFDDLPAAKADLMYCPKCGKRNGAELEIDDLPRQLTLGITPAPIPNRKCLVCEHKWIEL